MRFFDAHTHAHFAAFAEDSDSVIRRALEGGTSMILVGTQRDTSRTAVEAAARYPEGVYAAVGLHPIHTDKSYHDPKELGAGGDGKGFTSRGEEFDPAYYEELGRHPKVVAVGECGLDYYRIESSNEDHVASIKAKQKKVFEAHLALAHRLKKPLMIHCRDAFADLTTSLLASRSSLLPSDPGVIHFFTGTAEDACHLVDLGFSFTFGGVITFTHDYDAAIAVIPEDRILSETDAPYVAPAPYRGKRNEPLYVRETVRRLAELKGVSFEEMAETTFGNALKVFRIPSKP